ncbi:hypothetical protein KKF61_09030 [Patescibacteria group bacterium]|nr:hypothetical protein [Patescibacteria group bacterium]
MRFDSAAQSGYLEKFSIINYAAARLSTPEVWIGDDLRVGQAYWAQVKPVPRQHWALWRTLLSFPTGRLGGKQVFGAVLWLSIKTNQAYTDFDMLVRSHGSTPYGGTLDAGDWNKCDALDATLPITSSTAGLIGIMLDESHINNQGDTQFNLLSSRDLAGVEPPGLNNITLHGRGTAGEPYLMVETANVNDGVCLNVQEVLDGYKTQLGVNIVHTKGLNYVGNPPEIQVQWGGTTCTDKLRVTADIYYINRVIPPGDPTAALHGVDELARQKADLIRRILRFDKDCNGYMNSLESITCDPALITSAEGVPFMQGSRTRATWVREIGEDDIEPVLVD